MAGRRVKRGWWVVGGMAVAAIVWFGTPQVFRRFRFFDVRRVEIVGARHLSADIVLDALAMPADANVFDGFKQAERRIREIPGVLDARIGRRIPGTLRVVVSEAEPVALSPAREGLALVDASGVTVPFDPARSAPDLPLIAESDSVLTALLARVRSADPDLFSQVSAASRRAGDVVLDLGQWRLWLRSDIEPEVLIVTMDVARDLTRRGWRFQELDARFDGQVIVRGRVG
jgi:cell division septal protein FtsQ